MNGENNRSGKGKSSLLEPVDYSESFQLKSVDKASPPLGTEGEDWYRFVVAGGKTKIVSYQRGARDTVLLAIDRYLSNLNGGADRNAGTVH